MSRPKAVTEPVILELEKRYRDGATTLECINGIIAESTYYDYLKNDIEFSERMSIAREYTTELAQAVIARRVKRGDVDSAKWWLERKNKKEFSTRTETTGADGKDLQPILVKFMDEDTDNK